MANNTIRTYSPQRVTCIVNGFEVTGFQDGTFINITQVSDGITTQVGADGEIARAINTDRRCNVVITLQQTSPANDFLTEIYDADVLTCGGVVGPIQIQDLCGSTMFSASNCWVTKLADIEFAKEITARAWTLQTGAPGTHVVGSNAPSN